MERADRIYLKTQKPNRIRMVVLRLSKPCVRSLKYLLMLFIVSILLGYGFVNQSVDSFLLSSVEFDNPQAFKEAVDDLSIDIDPNDRVTDQLDEALDKEGAPRNRIEKVRIELNRGEHITKSKYQLSDIEREGDPDLGHIEELNHEINYLKAKEKARQRLIKIADQRKMDRIRKLNLDVQRARQMEDKEDMNRIEELNKEVERAKSKDIDEGQ